MSWTSERYFHAAGKPEVSLLFGDGKVEGGEFHQITCSPEEARKWAAAILEAAEKTAPSARRAPSILVVTESQVSKPTGSVMNNIMVGGKQPEPEIGMGATICMYTDRKAATVIAIERFKGGKRAGQVKAVTVQEDHAKRIDKNGMSESQEYEYSPDPNGPTYTFKVNAKGGFGSNGSGGYLALGFRQKYHDYSF